MTFNIDLVSLSLCLSGSNSPDSYGSSKENDPELCNSVSSVFKQSKSKGKCFIFSELSEFCFVSHFCFIFSLCHQEEGQSEESPGEARIRDELERMGAVRGDVMFLT